MQEIIEYTLTNGKYKLKFLNLGAVITEYSINGHNVVLRYKDYENYRNNMLNLGAIVGRSAGRTKDGKIEGWQLPLNQDGKHNLHGNKLQYRFYDVKVSENSAELTTYDAEGDFPGNATITVRFELTGEGLLQEIEAKSDKPTLFNLTNHSYFNLDMPNSILDHELLIETNQVKELDEDLLPVGELEIEGTAFDFSKSKKIRQALEMGHEQFKYSKFIDHPYHIKGDIKLSHQNLTLQIESDQDYLVVYGGNYIGEETRELENLVNEDYYGICLETQAVPGTTGLTKNYKSRTKFKLY